MGEWDIYSFIYKMENCIQTVVRNQVSQQHAVQLRRQQTIYREQNINDFLRNLQSKIHITLHFSFDFVSVLDEEDGGVLPLVPGTCKMTLRYNCFFSFLFFEVNGEMEIEMGRVLQNFEKTKNLKKTSEQECCNIWCKQMQDLNEICFFFLLMKN